MFGRSKQPKPFFFLHIPKTGGMSLRALIEANYAPEQRIELTDPKELWHVSDAELAQYQALYGHIGYGLRARLPKHYACFTFLRDPIERLISLYEFWQRVYDEADERNGPKAATGYDLNDFMLLEDEGLMSGMDNLQCWLLFKDKGLVVRRQFAAMSPEEVYEQALKHAKAMDFIGIQERSDTDIEKIRQLLDWKKPDDLPRLNVTGRKYQKSDLNAKALARAEHLTAWDRRLYEVFAR